MSPKERALHALESSKGDDLYRARLAFKGQNLNEQYGQSGKTRGQILADYEQREKEVNEAIEWVKKQN